MKPIIRVLDAQTSGVVVVGTGSRTADRKRTTTLGHAVVRTPHHFHQTSGQSSGVCVCIIDVPLFMRKRSGKPSFSMKFEIFVRP
jgi:hypothetical protein